MSNDKLLAILAGTSTVSPSSSSSQQAMKFVLDGSSGFKEDLLASEQQRKEELIKKEAQDKLKASLGEHDVLLSQLTHGELPTSGIDRIFKRFAPDHFPEEMRCDIPAVDTTYYWSPDLLEAMWLGYYMNMRTLLVGPPGTGKTSAAKQLAAILRQPFGRFNGKDGIDGSSFLGSAWVSSGAMEWKDGLMPQCVSNGYLTVIDEVMKLPPGIQMAMQSLYEDDGFLMLDDKPGTIKDKHIYPHENFRLFATDNTKGTGDQLDKYAAGQFQDVSTLDRFGLTYEVDYLPCGIEINMLKGKFPSAPQEVIGKIVALAKLVRNAYEQSNIAVTLSPRGLQNIMRFFEQGVSLETAYKMAFVNKLGDDAEVRAAMKFVSDCV